MEPSLLAVLLIRIIICVLCGFFLFKNWVKVEKKFYSDFPFLFSLMFFTLAAAKAIDFYIVYNFTMSETGAFFFSIMQFRFFVMAVNVCQMLIVVMVIWFKEKLGLQVTLLSIYALLWGIGFLVSPNYETLSKIPTYLLTPVLFVIIFTFFFIHHQKRLASKVNALLIAIGATIYGVSNAVRPFLVRTGGGEWGLSWLAEIIDLAGWIVMFLGFLNLKPVGMLKPRKISHQNISSK